jgi:hypothetical protein
MASLLCALLPLAVIANASIGAITGGISPVPEPGQIAASLLLLAGIGGYAFLKRRKTGNPAAA